MKPKEHVGTIDLGSGLIDNFTYYCEELRTKSSNLGKELGIAHQSGYRRTLGILADSKVVWSCDPRLPRHLYLEKAVNIPAKAQFQNIKIPGEYIPRIKLSGQDKVDIISLTEHILLSQPHFTLKISLYLINEHIATDSLFSGTVQELKRVICKL